MFRQIFIRLLLSLIVIINAYGQGDDYTVDNVIKQDGLSSTEITSMVQDKQGFIWIGTRYGLNRYDGYSIKVYLNIPGDPNSLCDNNISTLFVDRQGKLWIGTTSKGISVYDTSEDKFVNYNYKSGDHTSLPSYYISDIKEDNEGNIWVATVKGVNRYIPESNNFQRYLQETRIAIRQSTLDSIKLKGVPPKLIHLLAQSKDIKKGYKQFVRDLKSYKQFDPYVNTVLKYCDIDEVGYDIKLIEPDNMGNIWMNFEDDGLACFNPKANHLKTFDRSFKCLRDVSSNEILSLCWDKDKLWIGKTDGLLYLFDVKKGTLKPYASNQKGKFVNKVLRDSEGQIWAGDEAGLLKYYRDSDLLKRIDPQLDEKVLLSDVSCLLEDNQKNLWVATHKGLVNLCHKNKAFDHYKSYKNTQSGHFYPEPVSAVLEDSEGNVWVGYYTSGIEILPKGGGKKTLLLPEASGLGYGTVFKIFEDSKKNIWVGDYDKGFLRFDKQKKKFIAIDFDRTERNDFATSICEDHQGNLWISFFGNGVKKYDPVTRRFKKYKIANHSISDWTNVVYCDRTGRILIGSGLGLSILDPETGDYTNYNVYNSNLSHGVVRAVFQDSENRVWVGTENGLNLLDEKNKRFKIYSTQNGLSNNFISGIQEDSEGFLWIATYKGIARFNPETNAFKNYFSNSGMRSNEFFWGAYAKGKGGKMYFGSKNGLISFDPKILTTNPFKPKVLISDFKIFNKSVTIGKAKDDLLTRHISKTKSIALPFNHNVISFEFTALSYINAAQNSYAYMLDGFDKDWNFVGNKREVTYTNLNPGQYMLKVKAANSDGVWNDQETALQITIEPPFWKTSYAKILYLFTVLLTLYTAYRLALKRIGIKNKMELDELKLSFFINISHEFRTPLTLILSPLNYLSALTERLSTTQKELFEIMERNVQRLLRLTNQLMDVYELDAGFMKLKVEEGDLAGFLKTVVETFRYNAIKRNIKYNFTFNLAQSLHYFDKDKLEKILFNLISNAFKYTTDGGTILVECTLLDNQGILEAPDKLTRKKPNSTIVKIMVKDNGKGIEKKFQEKIFDRFFKIENKGHEESSTGIGLALAKQLALIHYGDITLESLPGVGSKFLLWLPVDKKSFSEDEIINPKDRIESMLKPLAARTESSAEAPLALTSQENLPILLVIEDNEDMRRYIKLYFRKEFQVEEAENGQEGLNKAFELIPDIIISDVMMPFSDGVEVCNKLKLDFRTCHIPVILLTARADENFQLYGLKEGGADDYITKPFNISILSARLNNMLLQRERLKTRLQIEINSQSDKNQPKEILDPLLQNIIELVEKNISNPELEIDTLCKELGLSQSNLYRKLQGVIGMSPIQLIKCLRLRRALFYLNQNKYTIAEISNMVGFNDPKYFSKLFKKAIGLAPSEYNELDDAEKEYILKSKASLEKIDLQLD